MTLSRGIKDGLKQIFFRVYKLGTRFGFHVLPVHYYASEPDIHKLAGTQELWARPSTMPGVDIDVDGQLKRLEETCLPFQSEYAGNAHFLAAAREGFGPGYGYVEAQALHAVLRRFKPGKVVEIGGGVSTYCSYQSLRQNGTAWEITCIEPHPSRRLRLLAESESRVRLVDRPVQAVSMDEFVRLSENDVLFVDSSHVVKAGSDVNHIVLEILPRLRPGVLVHFHDIYFPYDYQRDVLQTFLHNNETSLLRAFLIFNKRFKIHFSLSHLHYERTDGLRSVFPEYRPQSGRLGLRDRGSSPDDHFPSSIWLQVVQES